MPLLILRNIAKYKAIGKIEQKMNSAFIAKTLGLKEAAWDLFDSKAVKYIFIRTYFKICGPKKFVEITEIFWKGTQIDRLYKRVS